LPAEWSGCIVRARSRANGNESAVETAPKLRCPKCGSSDTNCVGVEPIYASEDRERHKPISRIIAFKCECGTDFTETVREPPPSPEPPARPLPPPADYPNRP